MLILFCLSYLLTLRVIALRCSRVLLVSVFCVLQGSGVTPFKCGEIYDMDFVANLTDNTIVEKF